MGTVWGEKPRRGGSMDSGGGLFLLVILASFWRIEGVKIEELEDTEVGGPYSFQYSVKDQLENLHFGHTVREEGKLTHGEYRVLLPDGRTQVVRYQSGGNSGYRARVSYEGTAKTHHMEEKNHFKREIPKNAKKPYARSRHTTETPDITTISTTSIPSPSFVTSAPKGFLSRKKGSRRKPTSFINTKTNEGRKNDFMVESLTRTEPRKDNNSGPLDLISVASSGAVQGASSTPPPVAAFTWQKISPKSEYDHRQLRFIPKFLADATNAKIKRVPATTSLKIPQTQHLTYVPQDALVHPRQFTYANSFDKKHQTAFQTFQTFQTFQNPRRIRRQTQESLEDLLILSKLPPVSSGLKDNAGIRVSNQNFNH